MLLTGPSFGLRLVRTPRSPTKNRRRFHQSKSREFIYSWVRAMARGRQPCPSVLLRPHRFCMFYIKTSPYIRPREDTPLYGKEGCDRSPGLGFHKTQCSIDSEEVSSHSSDITCWRSGAPHVRPPVTSRHSSFQLLRGGLEFAPSPREVSLMQLQFLPHVMYLFRLMYIGSGDKNFVTLKEIFI